MLTKEELNGIFLPEIRYFLNFSLIGKTLWEAQLLTNWQLDFMALAPYWQKLERMQINLTFLQELEFMTYFMCLNWKNTLVIPSLLNRICPHFENSRKGTLKILQQKMVKWNTKVVAQILVQWRDEEDTKATWEDYPSFISK